MSEIKIAGMPIYPGWLFIIITILVIIPVLSPIGLPFPISEMTQDYYDVMEALQPGDTVLLECSMGVSVYPDMRPNLIATMKYLWQQDLNILFVHYSEQTPVLLRDVWANAPPEDYGKVYGEDYVELPYLGGGEAVQVAIIQDIHGVAPNDYYGTPLSQLPMMADIYDSDDIDILIMYSGSNTQLDTTTRNWGPLNKPILLGGGTGFATSAIGYYPHILKGACLGVRAGAELETLIGEPGLGITFADAQSLVIGVLVLMTLGANVYELVIKKEDKKKK
jgi:hypothetical protein